MKISVLLSTYNGEKFLGEQLDSLIAQKLPTNCELYILVRDDGSCDSTTDILDEYKSKCNLKWFSGPNLKPAKSFWNLVNVASKADYYCFCDQDDFWFEDKIARAVKALQNEVNQNLPLLYCSNVTVTDSKLIPLNVSAPNRTEVYTDFPHSLVYSLAPGCTMMFNEAARSAFIKYNMDCEFEIIHDWLAHKIVAMLGKVIYDNEPTMYYRQHGNNVIGAQDSNKIKRFFVCAKRMFTSSANVRSENAKSLMNVYADEISQDYRHILNIVSNYRLNKNLKREFLESKLFVGKKEKYLKWLVRFNKV